MFNPRRPQLEKLQKNWISVASAADVFTDQAVGTVESMQPWWWRVVVEVEEGGGSGGGGGGILFKQALDFPPQRPTLIT